jgi:hypothetical protein
MVTGIEPSVVGMAQRIKFADVDHEMKVAPQQNPSSVSRVT